MTAEALHAAVEHLIDRLSRLGPDVHVARRLIAAGTGSTTTAEGV